MAARGLTDIYTHDPEGAHCLRESEDISVSKTPKMTVLQRLCNIFKLCIALLMKQRCKYHISITFQMLRKVRCDG